MAEKFKFMVFKLNDMSPDGFKRLGARTRLNYIKQVYKPLEKVELDYNSLYDEKSLASILIHKFGAGTYTGHAWKKNGYKFTKQLFKVVLRGNALSNWSYEYTHSRGMSRYKFWMPEY